MFIAGKQRFTPVLDDYTDHEEAQIVEEEDSFQHAIASMRKGSTPEPPRLWNNSPPVQQQQAVRPVVVQSPIALETSMVDIAAELEMLSLATGELGSSSVGDGYVNQSAQAGSAEPDSPIALTVDTIDAFNIKLKQSLQLSEVEAVRFFLFFLSFLTSFFFPPLFKELQAAIRTLKTADDIIDLGADESASVRSFQTSAMQVAMDNIRLNMGEFISEVAGTETCSTPFVVIFFLNKKIYFFGLHRTSEPACPGQQAKVPPSQAQGIDRKDEQGRDGRDRFGACDHVAHLPLARGPCGPGQDDWQDPPAGL